MPSSLNGTGVTFNDGSTLQSGNIPAANLGSGTANSSTFLRGDRTFATLPPPQLSATAGNIFYPLGTNLPPGQRATTQRRQLTMRAHASGTLNVRVTYFNGNNGATVSTTFTQRIFINGVAVGAEVSASNAPTNTERTLTSSVLVNLGDEVAVFVRVSNTNFTMQIRSAFIGTGAPVFAPALSTPLASGAAFP